MRGVAVVLVLLGVGCGKDQGGPPDPPPNTPVTTAKPSIDAPTPPPAAWDPMAEPTADGGFPGCPPGASIVTRVPEVQNCSKNGKPHGPSVTLWSTASGKRKSYSSYVDGVMTGPQVGWDEQGRKTFYAMNNKEGRWIGTVTRWRDGKKDGEVGEYDENGKQIRVTTWSQDQKLTTAELECPAGTEKKVARHLNLSEDSLRDNVTRMTCEKNGKPNGPYLDLYPGGALEVAGTMVDGVRTGLETHYHDTGQKFIEGKRVKGVKVGTWTIWRTPSETKITAKAEEEDYDAKGIKIEERSYAPSGAMTGGAWYENDELVDIWRGERPARRPKKK